MFKVGDWCYHENSIKQIDFIDEDTICGDESIMISFTNNSYGYTSDCELWQPKEGEWCWFYSELNERPYIDKFITMKGDYYKTLWWNDNFQFCEPFIGELPSFLKESR